MTKKFKGKLNDLFPPSSRKYSATNMHYWVYGSLEVICEGGSTKSTTAESNLPKIDMMEMMQNERLSMTKGENDKIIWLFDGKPYTGYIYGEQRGKKIEGEFKNGLEHGSQKEWHDNGQLKKERIYDNGTKISTKTWDKDGKVTSDIKH